MDVFPSTLITSNNQTDIDGQIAKMCQKLGNNLTLNNPDILIINQDTGWTIELIRQTRHFLSQKPFSHITKIIIIYQAENLNLESQNALLKTLEEPGLNNYVILSTSKPSKLLPTIISRCQIVKLKNNHQVPDSQLINISHNIQKDLLTSESLSKDKTQVLPFLENQIKLQQKLLIKHPSLKTSSLVQKLIKATQMIHANVDPKSVMDFIFLS